MKKYLIAFILLLLSYSAHAALLTGQTPSNYSVPSGWTVIRTQDFEGAQPSGESWSTQYALPGGVATDRYHSGSKSLYGTYAWGQAAMYWQLPRATVGSYTELYVSFYEYIESQALFNDEFFLAQFYHPADASYPFQEIILDWYWAPGFNKPSANLYIVPQGVRSKRFGPTGGTINTGGTWRQWEIYFRPNTSSGGVANTDGFMRVYRDGTLYLSQENDNFNGTVPLQNSQTIVKVGGLYTKAVWMMNYPTCTSCSTYPGNGTDLCTNPNGWASATFSAPICRAAIYGGAYDGVDNPFPSFKRYFDDIIVMKYTGGSEDITPNPFSFTDNTGVPISSPIYSTSIQVLGINGTTSVSVAGTGCEYKKNAGSWTSSSGTAILNDTLSLRTTSSGSYSTLSSCTLYVGGVSDTWNVTTTNQPLTGQPSPPSSIQLHIHRQ